MESADACGDSSAPVLGVHAVDGGTILFGVLPPEPVAVEWETGDGMASGSVMFVSSGPREEGIPFVTAIPAAAITKGHGQLVVRFPGAGDSVAYPEWRTDLPNRFNPRHLTAATAMDSCPLRVFTLEAWIG